MASNLLRQATLLATALLCGCGANVSKTYESDVRFERCYSLDWHDGVDPELRRKCWEEWAQHYSEGQPRDRVQFAKRQLVPGAGPEAASSSTVAPASSAPGGALPEPTSVFSPMPMMATPGAATASAAAVVAQPATRSACETRCDKALEACLGGCSSAVCEGYCSQRHSRCTPKCSPAAKSVER